MATAPAGQGAPGTNQSGGRRWQRDPAPAQSVAAPKQPRLAGAVYGADLPRNPNGKILKRELRKQYADWEKAR